MNFHMSGIVAHLEGDLTLSGVSQSNIHSLAVSLEQIGSRSEKKIRIDCEQIKEVDTSGLQLIHIWLLCFIFRGIKPELVNLPDRLQKTFQSLGFLY